MAPAGEERPGRLNQVLQAGADKAAGNNVFHHAKPATRPENAPDLSQRLRRLRHTAEDETADHSLERPVAKRKRFGARAHQRNLRRAQPRTPERIRGGVEPDRVSLARKQRQAPSSAAAQVHYLTPRSPCESYGTASHAPSTR